MRPKKCVIKMLMVDFAPDCSIMNKILEKLEHSVFSNDDIVIDGDNMVLNNILHT